VLFDIENVVDANGTELNDLIEMATEAGCFKIVEDQGHGRLT
jgi:hypothetical protein